MPSYVRNSDHLLSIPLNETNKLFSLGYDYTDVYRLHQKATYFKGFNFIFIYLYTVYSNKQQHHKLTHINFI